MGVPSVLIGAIDIAPGRPSPLPTGAQYEGVRQLLLPLGRSGGGQKAAVHAYIHRDSGRRYFLLPLGRPPAGGPAGGWRLYEYGPGDCPCSYDRGAAAPEYQRLMADLRRR